MSGSPSPDTLARWDLSHVWHPFTQADEWEADGPPLIIDRAEGVVLIDVHGRRYLDGISSLWTNVHGHDHPHMLAELKAQLDRVSHSTLLGQAGTPSIVLAKRLADLVARIPGDTDPLTRLLQRLGSTSVEVAPRSPSSTTSRPARPGAASPPSTRPGDTVGMSVGIDLFHESTGCCAVRIPRPTSPTGMLARPSTPGTGPGPGGRAAGPGRRRCMHSADFLRRLTRPASTACWWSPTRPRALAARARSSRWSRPASARICSASPRLPLAATLTTEAVYDAFRGPYPEHRTFFHGHTYTGNALACTAAPTSTSSRTARCWPASQAAAALAEAVSTLDPRHVVTCARRHHVGSCSATTAAPTPSGHPPPRRHRASAGGHHRAHAAAGRGRRGGGHRGRRGAGRGPDAAAGRPLQSSRRRGAQRRDHVDREGDGLPPAGGPRGRHPRRGRPPAASRDSRPLGPITVRMSTRPRGARAAAWSLAQAPASWTTVVMAVELAAAGRPPRPPAPPGRPPHPAPAAGRGAPGSSLGPGPTRQAASAPASEPSAEEQRQQEGARGGDHEEEDDPGGSAATPAAAAVAQAPPGDRRSRRPPAPRTRSQR